MQLTAHVSRETRRETPTLADTVLKGLDMPDGNWADRVPQYPRLAIEDRMLPAERVRYAVARTLKASARVHGVNLSDPTLPAVRARMIAMFLLHTWFGVSHTRLAQLCDAKRNTISRNIETIRCDLSGPGRVLPITLLAIVDEMSRDAEAQEAA